MDLNHNIKRGDSAQILKVASLLKLSETSYSTTQSKPWKSLSDVTKFATNSLEKPGIWDLELGFSEPHWGTEGRELRWVQARQPGMTHGEGKPLSSQSIGLRTLVNDTKSENNNKTLMEWKCGILECAQVLGICCAFTCSYLCGSNNHDGVKSISALTSCLLFQERFPIIYITGEPNWLSHGDFWATLVLPNAPNCHRDRKLSRWENSLFFLGI